jgi:hypothetical protein
MALYNDDEIFGGEHTSYTDYLVLPFQSDGSEVAELDRERDYDIFSDPPNVASRGRLREAND